MKIYGDNMSAINMIENSVQYDRSKHIQIDKQFIREKIEDYTIRIADILTKSVTIQVFQTLVTDLGHINIYT